MVLKKKESTTEAFDALKRINELERENASLKKKNKLLRFESLPMKEREWAERAYRVINGAVAIDAMYDDFRCSYIDKKDFDESLPFDDVELPFDEE